MNQSNADLCPVMLFSGKGGVGKTTLAAATAVRLARSGSKVLLMSSDPAHSLSDVFDIQLGAEPIRILDGLDVMEVDAKEMFAGAFGDAAQSMGGFGKLAKMASDTPGIDEFGAIEVLMQALETAYHDVVIMDTAPTGHTLRLLMLPELLDGWFGTLMELRGKIARAGKLLRKVFPGSKADDDFDMSAELSGGRDRVLRLRNLLTDGDKAQIILVTIPEAMSVLETSRTLDMLSKSSMPVGTVLVNQVQPESGDCGHCERRWKIHQRELADMRRRAGTVPVRVVESLPWELRGFDALEKVGNLAWGGDATSN
jgi:arsenite/tail-anchored protein-transporting ATPase